MALHDAGETATCDPTLVTDDSLGPGRGGAGSGGGSSKSLTIFSLFFQVLNKSHLEGLYYSDEIFL